MTNFSCTTWLLAAALAGATACSDNTTVVADSGIDGPGSCASSCQTGYFCCQKTQTCERNKYNCVNLQTCAPGMELSYPAPPYMDENTCEPLPLQCTCKEGEALKPGLIGRFSALAAASGTLYASAYDVDFGDLILVTAKTSALDSPTREIVDGVPASPPSKAPSGWRGGVQDPGDDVGQDTDIVMGESGEPMIAYRDVTHRSLKLASRAGGKWSTHTVDTPKTEKEVVGRYGAILLEGGKPAVAYLVLGIAGSGGTFTSELRWAAASSASPATPGDWTIGVIESKPMPCQNLCAATQACVLKTNGSSSCQAKSTTCSPACTGDDACVAGTCQPTLPDVTYVDVPRGVGLWPAPVLTASGPVVVYYDRAAGRLRAAKRSGTGTWTPTTLASSVGEDVGAFPSAVAGATGNVHVSFQNASKLSLHYLQLDPATMALSGAVETIDDGARPDGPHPVGADSAIALDASGTVRVIYQDSQKVDLLHAKRPAAGGWTPNVTTDPDLGRALRSGAKGYGFYNELVLEGGQLYVSSFFYDGSSSPKGDLAFFSLP